MENVNKPSEQDLPMNTDEKKGLLYTGDAAMFGAKTQFL